MKVTKEEIIAEIQLKSVNGFCKRKDIKRSFCRGRPFTTFWQACEAAGVKPSSKINKCQCVVEKCFREGDVKRNNMCYMHNVMLESGRKLTLRNENNGD
jgi:hypothetical protein